MSHISESSTFVLDSILCTALSMRQKYKNLTLILKQYKMLDVTTSLTNQELHNMVETAIKNLFEPRSKQALVIILLYASIYCARTCIRVISSPNKRTNRFSECDNQMVSEVIFFLP